MTRRARLILSGVIAAVTGLLGAGLARLAGSKAVGLPVVGQVIPAVQRPPAPGISGTTLTGRHLNIVSWRAKRSGSTSGGRGAFPCRKEAPVLARVADDTRSLGVRFLGIDIREEPSAGRAFERQHHIPYPSISDPGDLIAARFGTAAPGATPVHVHPRRPRPDRLGLVRRDDLRSA